MAGNTKSILFLLLFTLANKQLLAQKALSEVSVDLGSGVFFGEPGLPFDVPFRIGGPITPNLRKITVQYRISPTEFKKWMRFPCGTKGAWSDASTWKYTDEPAKDQKYHLLMGRLHPNIGYEFKFTILKTPSLDQVKRDELKKTLFESLSATLEDLTVINDPSLTTLNATLNQKMQMAVGPGGAILNNDETPFALDLMANPLKNTTNEIITTNLNLLSIRNEVITSQNVFNTTSSPRFVTLIDVLDKIKRNTIQLDAASTLIWNAPVAPAVPSLKDLTFLELATLLTDASQNWAQVIEGKSKITKLGLAPSDAVDAPSFQVLTAFLTLIANGKIADNTAAHADPFGPAVQARAFFLAHLSSVQANLEEIKRLTQKKADLLKNFPDVLTDKLISLSYVIIDHTVTDVVSQNTPYIGLDFGFAYVPNYSQLFLYEGVNFYFVPVNKDAPLSRMKGFWNSLSKRASIHLGLTQSLIAVEKKNYKDLINGVGSLLLGAGLRVSRIVRINYGTIFFYEKNPNPIIDKKSFKTMYAFSMTFDINIVKALGSIGTRLGK